MNELEGISTGAGASGAFTMEDLQNLFGGAVMSSSLYTYILSIINNIFGVINQCGVQILIFIAGLQSISPSVYEAASIEGANGWDCYWKITFPLIGPMIYVNALHSGGFLHRFLQPDYEGSLFPGHFPIQNRVCLGLRLDVLRRHRAGAAGGDGPDEAHHAGAKRRDRRG